MGLVADDAVDAHGRGRLDDDHADDDEVPKAEGAMEADGPIGRGRGCGGRLALLRHNGAP